MATLSDLSPYNTHRPNIVHLGRAAAAIKPTPAPPLPEDQQSAPQQEQEDAIDIVINNVVCTFSVRCHLNLRQIALTSVNVEYKRENGMLTMKLRKPYTTASMWSSGKITCTGATSEESSLKAARRFARVLQNLGFRVHFCNFRVVNVLGTCSMPFGILIFKFSEDNRGKASYEPELHPGVTYKIKELKATLKIFSTGSITITAPSVAAVQSAVEYIYPIVYQYRKEKVPKEQPKKKQRVDNFRRPPHHRSDSEEEEDIEDEEDDFDSGDTDSEDDC